MHIKRIKEKLKEVDVQSNDLPPVVFKKNGKFYCDPTYCDEIDQSVVIQNNIVSIEFKKQNNLSVNV